jgi:hypothetical protein
VRPERLFNTKMNKLIMPSTPALVSMLAFLLAYAVLIFALFRTNKWGQRRKWMALDYIWVPLGLVTGVCLLAMWWQSHGPWKP